MMQYVILPCTIHHLTEEVIYVLYSTVFYHRGFDAKLGLY